MFGIDDIIGAFTGGGGSSSSSVTSNVNLTVAGLNDMKQAITLQGGDKPIAVTEVIELKPRRNRHVEREHQRRRNRQAARRSAR